MSRREVPPATGSRDGRSGSIPASPEWPPPGLPLPVREDVEPNASRGYGKAKWGAEQEVWARSRDGMPVVVA